MLNFDPSGDNIEILKADSCGQWVDRIPVYTLTMYIYIYLPGSKIIVVRMVNVYTVCQLLSVISRLEHY